MFNKTTKKILDKITWYLPHKMAHSIIYLRCKKKFLNWKNPKLYDEYIHYLLGTKYDYSYGRYVDKYVVRDYVKECGLEDLLIPLYGVYKNVDEIDFFKLPEKYILMANHSCGSNNYFICDGKTKVDETEVRKKFNEALKKKYSRNFCEYQYEKIEPVIMCEQLLEDDRQERLDDYKVVCADGVPQKILVCTNRDKGRDYYSTDWKYLDHVKEEYRSGKLMPKPKCLEQMLNAAAILSKPFPLARIDFYIVNDRLYFGEITLSPCGGHHTNLNEKGQREWRNLA
jgi:hypothetical protein